MGVIDMKTAAKMLSVTPRQAAMLFDAKKLKGWRIPGSNARRTTTESVEMYAKRAEFMRPVLGME